MKKKKRQTFTNFQLDKMVEAIKTSVSIYLPQQEPQRIPQIPHHEKPLQHINALKKKKNKQQKEKRNRQCFSLVISFLLGRVCVRTSFVRGGHKN